jgi:glycosyltransferase involved in cell wall biosynthesis
MVAIEALTTGTPVLSADTAGGIEVRDCFPDDVELVPRGDPAALATAVVRWLDHSRRTGDATRRRLEQEFTPAALAGAYLEIYREALGQRR